MAPEEFENKCIEMQAEIGKIVMVSMMGDIPALRIIEEAVRPKVDEYRAFVKANSPYGDNVVKLR